MAVCRSLWKQKFVCYDSFMISYRDVSKIYNTKVAALREVNLEVESGEFVFLVGPSGAGKTTLLKLLIREDLPTAGEIWFEDKNVCRLSGAKVPILRREIGMVFQDFKLLPKRTVYENVAFALEVAGRPDAEIAEVVPYLLEQIGLQDLRNSFPHQLSAGEAQRVALARALVHEPKVLLADEPTGNLDYENSWQIVRLLDQVNSWGTTVIMASHDREIVSSLKRRTVKIEKGEIVSDK